MRTYNNNQPPNKKPFSYAKIIHLIPVLLLVLIIAVLIHKLINWGHFINPDEITTGEDKESFDSILPLLDRDGMPVYTDSDSKTTIVCFGNAPFADDRNSKDGLTSIIADMTGATVYNCSISGSYLSSLPYETDNANLINPFSFYWLCHLATGNLVNQSYLSALPMLDDKARAEAQEVYNTVKSIDFSNVDVIAVMYDANDYLDGRPFFNEENRTDIDCFSGSLEAGLQLLKETYPHIRLIVLSPPYAYSDKLDENGNYISSELDLEKGSLYNYIIAECMSCSRNTVTFIDMYSTITGANADQYLIDHLHLNKDGRKKTAERFIYALEYYSKQE